MSNKKFKQKTQKVKVERVKKEPSMARRYLVGSLINNRAAYDGGRSQKWYLAVILFIFSIVIALVPPMVQISRTKGSDTFNANLYHTDVALVKFAQKLDEQNVDLVVKEVSGEKVFTDNGTNFATLVATANFTLTDTLSTQSVPYYSFTQTREVTVRNSAGEIVTEEIDFEYLRVYYTANIETTFIFNNSTGDAGSYLATKLLNLEGEAAKDNVTSHMIIGKTKLFTRIYDPNKLSDPKTPYRSFEGRTSTLPVDLNIRNFATKNMAGDALLVTDLNYATKVLDNFAALQDLAYKAVKPMTFWLQTGIYAVIFTLIGLVMGLIIFISTRGKMNPNRDLKFIEAMKVGAWLLPTPALLTLVLGFILPAQYFQMIFIMALGMRSVWLTMRTLGPQQQ
jgi:maltodextrin utilization protein YvdJ